MAKSGIRIEGIEDLRRLLEKGNKKVTQAARLAVLDAATEVADKSDNLVPEDSSDLRDSQMVKPPGLSGNNPTAEITFGGPAAPYAVEQHENLDLWHPPRAPGNKDGHIGTGPTAPGSVGSPKYLEWPLLEMAKTFDRRIIKTVKRLLR